VRVPVALQARLAAQDGEGGVARGRRVAQLPQLHVLMLDRLDQLTLQEGRVEEERHGGHVGLLGGAVWDGEGHLALLDCDEELVAVATVAVFVMFFQYFVKRFPISFHVRLEVFGQLVQLLVRGEQFFHLNFH
jgi:hypothetical protein